jgi:hypothetical protein
MKTIVDMKIESIAVGISALLYLGVSISFATKGNWGWALIWMCYTGANVGLMIVKK